MSETLPAVSGPDQLDNIAQVEEANGLYINAETFRQLARDWRQIAADLGQAQQRIAEQSRTIDRLHTRLNQVAVAVNLEAAA